MMNVIALISAMSNYIAMANSVYSSLEEYNEFFNAESKVVSYAKCYLLQNGELDDFNASGINVSVYENSNGYTLYFDDYALEIQVDNRQIVDFDYV